MAPAAQHDRVRDQSGAGPVVEVERERAEATIPGNEQLRDVLVLDHRDAQLLYSAAEGGEHGAPGPVARITRATPAVRAEEPLIDLPVRRARERAAPLDEFLDGLRRLADDGLDDVGVPEQVALAHRVGEVLLPGVLRISRPERGVDATGGAHRVRVQPWTLADDDGLAARFVRGDRGTQPGAARADHEHVDRMAAKV